MAGKIDKSQTYLLRAVDGDEWELWTFSESKQAQFMRRLSTPADVPGDTVIALPARRTVTFPTWLATSDRAVIPEMLHLQLEKRGLVGKNSGDSAVDYRVIEIRENQALAVATVLQPEFPPELTFERVAGFEPSAYTFPLPSDRLVIWREKGRLTVAATRGRDAVVVQVLSDRELSQAVVLELKCIAFQLQLQHLCERFLGITLWGEFRAEDIERLQTGLGLKVTYAAVPPPSLPTTRSKLLPPEVSILHARKRRRRRVRSGITLLAALYILGVLGLVGYIYWQRYVAGNLRRHLQDQAPTVNAVQGTAERWRQVEWAVNPKLYPVELFYQIASALPPDGLHLTAFEVQQGKVVIRGEASSAPAAFKFAEDVKDKPDLQMFTWQMPSPALRPDGRAEFTIEGDSKIAKIN